MNRMRQYAFGAALAAVFLLCIVWPIPRVIALRNILTGTIALLLLMICGVRILRLDRIPKAPLIYVAALTIWIVFSIIFWGERPVLSFREFLGHWVLPLACGFIGIKLADIAKSLSWTREKLATLIAGGLLLGIVLHNLFVLVLGAYIGQLPLRQAPTMYLPDMFYAVVSGQSILSTLNGSTLQQLSYTNNILAALLAAEVVQRTLFKRKFLMFGDGIVLFAIVMVLLCSYTLSVRNGNVGLLILILFSSTLVLMKYRDSQPKRRVMCMFLVAFVLIGGLGFVAYNSDPRWKGVLETVPLALDQETGSEWITETDHFPKLKDGTKAEGSTYVRLAFIREGLSLLASKPFGTGFHRNAFGYGVDEKYDLRGAKPGIHAHSGVIDFSIANGIPGIILWFAFLWTLFSAGLRAFRAGRHSMLDNIAPSLMLVFLVSGFFARSFVDSVFQGYELEQFMFLAGFFYVLTTNNKPNNLQ